MEPWSAHGWNRSTHIHPPQFQGCTIGGNYFRECDSVVVVVVARVSRGSEVKSTVQTRRSVPWRGAVIEWTADERAPGTKYRE